MNVLKPYGGIPGVCAECGFRYKGEFAHSCATGRVIGYCKDCKHWESDAIRREGLMSGSDLGFGFCRIAECATGEPKEVGNRLACGDGYDYGALLCKPDFGCVQFEARSDAQFGEEPAR